MNKEKSKKTGAPYPRPLICVPLTGATKAQLIQDLAEAVVHRPDLLEWRVDCFDSTDRQEQMDLLGVLGKQTEGIPLIFTWRSEREGGREIPLEDYRKLITAAANTGVPQYLDLEYSAGFALVVSATEYLKQRGIRVILSSHNFECTPMRSEMVKTLGKMRAYGADLGKLAVMPQSPEDVLELLAATVEMKELYPDFPIITMAMGKLGAVSRVVGQLIGSHVTFATTGRASAPGQLAIEPLRQMLDALGL